MMSTKMPTKMSTKMSARRFSATTFSILLVLFFVAQNTVDGARHHHHHRSSAPVQIPVPVAVAATAGRQPLVSPTICAAVTGFLVGIGIGIGFGALIFNRPYRNGGLGGGIWFGKRRKRSATQQFAPQYEEFDFDDEKDVKGIEILTSIAEAEEKYQQNHS